MHFELWAFNTGNLVHECDSEAEALGLARELLVAGWSADDLGLRIEFDDSDEADDDLLPPPLYGPTLAARLTDGIRQEIERTPGVVGGSARIAHTRIPVWLLEQARRLGTSPGDLLDAYPSLRLEDLVHAWGYAREHFDEIDREIAENEADEAA